MTLSPRQLQILQLMAEGKTIEETARELCTNRLYVVQDRQSIYRKLEADSGPHAVAIAFRLNLLK